LPGDYRIVPIDSKSQCLTNNFKLLKFSKSYGEFIIYLLILKKMQNKFFLLKACIISFISWSFILLIAFWVYYLEPEGKYAAKGMLTFCAYPSSHFVKYISNNFSNQLFFLITFGYIQWLLLGYFILKIFTEKINKNRKLTLTRYSNRYKLLLFVFILLLILGFLLAILGVVYNIDTCQHTGFILIPVCIIILRILECFHERI
jgi:hypothetical protein